MIPKIDVRIAIARREYAGEVRFSFEADEGLLDLPNVRFASCVQAALRYAISEDGSVQVEGTIAFTLEGLCSRCLDEAEMHICEDVQAVFTAGKPKDEEYGYRGIVDLTEFMRDSVLFALPSRLLCRKCAQDE